MNETPGTCIVPDLSSVETWVFDLDNTLYPAKINLFAQVDRRMTHFIMQRLALPFDKAHSLQKQYYTEYGTTLKGLIHEHGIAPDDYLAFVHDIDLSALTPCQELNRLLTIIPGRKLIFTNGSRDHALNVVRAMRLGDHFEAIFDSADAGYAPKHESHVFERFVTRHAIDPARAIMIDDIAGNLKPAHDLGLKTVWIRTARDWGAPQADGAAAGCHADYQAPDLIGFLKQIAAQPPPSPGVC